MFSGIILIGFQSWKINFGSFLEVLHYLEAQDKLCKPSIKFLTGPFSRRTPTPRPLLVMPLWIRILYLTEKAFLSGYWIGNMLSFSSLQGLFLFARFRKSLFQFMLGFFYQSLSVWDVKLPPVGPVQLHPLLLSLGVLQHSLPPQALPGLDAELCRAPLRRSSTATGFVCRRQQGRWVLEVSPAPPAAASKLLSILLTGGSELGQLASRLARTLRGRRGRPQGLRRQRYSLRFLCREAT